MDGFCQCGCGGLAPVAKRSSTEKGWIKGEPKRFIHNHHMKGERNNHWNGGRTENRGYVSIAMSDHPQADAHGFVREHILICEKVLGKLLPPGAIPHHVDGNPSNNENSNLVLCQDQAYHMLIERRARAFNACGHARWRKCQYCKMYDAPENLTSYQQKTGYEGATFHLSCHNDKQREYRRGKANG
jgi:hypothetical protein